MKYFTFVIPLVVCFLQITHCQDECPVSEEGIKFLCSAMTKITYNETEVFHEVFCGCAKSIFTGQIKFCQAKSSNISDMPNCDIVFKSKAFEEFIESSTKKLVYRKIITFLGKQVGICESVVKPSEEKVVRMVYNFLKSDSLLFATDSMLKVALSQQAADLFSKCLHEYSNKATAPK